MEFIETFFAGVSNTELLFYGGIGIGVLIVIYGVISSMSVGNAAAARMDPKKGRHSVNVRNDLLRMADVAPSGLASSFVPADQERRTEIQRTLARSGFKNPNAVMNFYLLRIVLGLGLPGGFLALNALGETNPAGVLGVITQYFTGFTNSGMLQILGALCAVGVALKVGISNWRWKGTPFYLRTGKRLRARTSEIAVVFNDPPHSIFEAQEERRGNVLAIRLQPNEGITMRVTIKEPGPGGMRLVEVPLDMTFADALGPGAEDVPDAYERLIMDVIRGNQTLFMRGDEVEAAWAWTDPIIAGWEARGDTPRSYDSGGSGPEDSLMLLHRDGRRWREVRA